MAPDAVIVQDATLINQVDLFSGLSPEGYVLINTSRTFEELGLSEIFIHFRPDRLLTCPATELALEHVGRPLPNAALLGGLAAMTQAIALDAINAAIRERFAGVVGERNAAAATAAYAFVTLEQEESVRASAN